MEKKKRKNLFDDRRVVLVLALLLAFLSWVVIAGFVNPGSERDIHNVQIDYDRNADTYKDRGLQVVGTLPDRYADVRVSGDGGTIGGLSHTSVSVYADYSAVDGPGIFEVPLRSSRSGDEDFLISDLSIKTGGYSLANNPKNTVTITFERVVTQQFPIALQADGITAAEGYFRGEYTMDTGRVSVAGPEPAMNRIAQVVAVIADEEERVESAGYTGVPITLLDSAGAVLDPGALGLTLSVETVNVDIPILQIVTIKLAVAFTGLPDYFDTEWFYGCIHIESVDELQVTGAAAALERLQNPYPIATFDAKNLSLKWQSDPINVTLPEGITNHDQLRQVTVSFDTTGFAEKTFEVEAENIVVVNGPRNAEITPVAEQVSVKLIGPEDQINALLPENIIIQVDAFSTQARTGQQTLPVRVLVPSANRVLAIETYPLVCDVTVE